MNFSRMLTLSILALAEWGCAPPDLVPSLQLHLTPGHVTGTAPIAVRATALTGAGAVGVGTVHIASGAGSLVDGVDLPLDGFGDATANLKCDPGTESACGQQVRIAATWIAGRRTAEAIAFLNADGAAGTGTGAASGTGGEVTGPPSAACGTAQMVGSWARSRDAFVFVIGASGCALTATGANNDFSHVLTGTMTAPAASFPVVMSRTVKATGCVTKAFGTINTIDPGVKFTLDFSSFRREMRPAGGLHRQLAVREAVGA